MLRKARLDERYILEIIIHLTETEVDVPVFVNRESRKRKHFGQLCVRIHSAGKIKMADDACSFLTVLVTTRTQKKEFQLFSCSDIPRKETRSDINVLELIQDEVMVVDLKYFADACKIKLANIYSERGRVAEYK